MKRQTHMDLFVYGTLKKDLRLHGLLEQQKFLGDFTTPPQYDITDYAPVSYTHLRAHET